MSQEKRHRYRDTSAVSNGRILKPQALIVAAAQGRRLTIQEHLSAGGHPDATVLGKPTAVCYAAMFDDVEMAWMLIKAGANLDYQDGAGNTACMYSVLAGSINVFELLLCNGADIALINKQSKHAMEMVTCAGSESSTFQQLALEHVLTQHKRSGTTQTH